MPLTPTPAPLSEEEIRAKLHAVFESFDKDASGAVSIDEMFEMCSNLNLGMSEDELRRLRAELALRDAQLHTANATILNQSKRLRSYEAAQEQPMKKFRCP